MENLFIPGTVIAAAFFLAIIGNLIVSRIIKKRKIQDLLIKLTIGDYLLIATLSIVGIAFLVAFLLFRAF